MSLNLPRKLSSVIKWGVFYTHNLRSSILSILYCFKQPYLRDSSYYWYRSYTRKAIIATQITIRISFNLFYCKNSTNIVCQLLIYLLIFGSDLGFLICFMLIRLSSMRFSSSNALMCGLEESYDEFNWDS